MEDWNQFIEIKLYPLVCILFQEIATLSSIFIIFIVFIVLSWHIPSIKDIWDHIKVSQP